jgi:Zn-dependent protease
MSRQAGSTERSGVPGLDLRIAGIPIRVDVTFVLMAVVLGQGYPGWRLLGWCVVVFASILVHELGHALTLRAFGDTPRITLWAFGGLTYPTKTLSPVRDVVVSLAGSVTQVLVLGLPAYVARSILVPSDVTELRWWLILSDLVWVSIGWALLNLLPILPLDGGQVIGRMLGHRAGRRGELAASLISIVTASAGGVWAFLASRPGTALYALFFVGWNAATLLRDRDERSRRRVGDGRRLLQDGRRTEAEAAFRDAMQIARSHATRADAGESLAWLLIEDGRMRDAREAADRIRPNPDDPSSLRASLDLLEGRSTEEAADAIAAWWLRHPRFHIGSITILELDRRGLLMRFLERLLADPSPHAAELAAATQASLHLGGRYGSAIDVGRRLFEDARTPSAIVAFNIACSTAQTGHLGLALDWLDRAVEAGWEDVGQLMNDEDLTDLRSLPRFEVIMSRVGRRRER